MKYVIHSTQMRVTFLRRSILPFLMLLSFALHAQRLYQISGIEADRGGSSLSNAWTGGFNNPVTSPIDLNQDSLMDLFIYDKAGQKVMLFINTGSMGHPSYRYAPEYDVMIPKKLNDWAVVRDFNGDGVPDIFFLTGNVNIGVYQGSRVPGGGLAFTLLTNRISFTYGAGISTWIFAYSDNMPVFADVDHDGDMDILAPDVTGSVILYYQNRSKELGYGLDSLIFTEASECWGSIYLASGCGVSYYSCKTGAIDPPQSASGQRDNGGALYGFDYQGDHDMDLLVADLACNSIKFLQNDGDSSAPVINYIDSLFPSYDRPVKMPTFPSACGADVDNDGYQDLLIAPFSTNSLYIMKSEDVKCLQFYQNDGPTPPLNRFHYMGDSLLTNTTLDVGTESHAVFFDYNNDGLMDIVVGNFDRFRDYPTLTLYVNTGNDTMPRFEEAVTNWSNLATFRLSGAYPAFGDLDGDGHPDMVIGDQMGYLQYFRNAGTDTATFPAMTQSNWFGLRPGGGAAPFIYDLNGDSLNDLIVGTTDSNIRYYWNYGTRATPLFSRDSSNAFLGHIKVSSTPAYTFEYRSPMIYKEGNQLFLYTGSREGRVEKYLVDPDSLRHGSFTQVSRDVIGISAGLHSTVSIADINHDGYNDYLTGNVRGGLMIFSDAYWGNGISLPTSLNDISHPDNKIQVYPVPSRDFVQCRFVSTNDQLVSAHLFDLLGQPVNAPVTDDGEGLSLSVSGLPAGIYIVQLTDQIGKTYQEKVSVMK